MDLVTVFLLPDVSHVAVPKAGENGLVTLYGGIASIDTLHGVRFCLFVQLAVNTKVNVARLLPTKETASFRSYRTYNQVQKWWRVEKDAIDWGWSKSSFG